MYTLDWSSVTSNLIYILPYRRKRIIVNAFESTIKIINPSGHQSWSGFFPMAGSSFRPMNGTLSSMPDPSTVGLSPSSGSPRGWWGWGWGPPEAGAAPFDDTRDATPEGRRPESILLTFDLSSTGRGPAREWTYVVTAASGQPRIT